MANVKFPTGVIRGVPVDVDMMLNQFPVIDWVYRASATASLFALYYTPTTYHKFTGTGLRYDGDGIPYAGTISSWTFTNEGKVAFQATGLNIPVATYMSFMENDDWLGLMRTAFAGNDTIVSSARNDTLEGFDGNDTIKGGAGNDTLYGDPGDDKLYGEAGNDTIFGFDDKDLLDGGAGADTLYGGNGDDVYIVDNLGDFVREWSFNDGIDEVRTSVPIEHGFDGIENYVYTGKAAWNFTTYGLDNRITSGAGNDVIHADDGGSEFLSGNDTVFGGAGNDTIDGWHGNDWLDGGTGKDRLIGGGGNDTYVIDNAGDTIEETTGHDTVRTTISVNLSILGAGLVEDAILTSAIAGSLTGNALDNALTGNAAANILDGRGGADIMSGGKGGDTYFVDNAADQVIETIAGAAGGTDLIKSAIDFDLSSVLNVENLTLIGAAHTATGNGLANVITGNELDNWIDGGAGKDRMNGGAGDDTYVVDILGDLVTESLAGAKGGIDTVRSSISYTLGANVENLVLTGAAAKGNGNALGNQIDGNSLANTLDGKAGDDRLFGDAGNDIIIGGAGNDRIDGGTGRDTMTGGTGRDTFHFGSLSEGGDTITDFAKGTAGDILDLADLLDDIGYGGSNPFADGVLTFTHSGKNTIVGIDIDGAGGPGATQAVVTLTNVLLGADNTANYHL